MIYIWLCLVHSNNKVCKANKHSRRYEIRFRKKSIKSIETKKQSYILVYVGTYKMFKTFYILFLKKISKFRLGEGGGNVRVLLIVEGCVRDDRFGDWFDRKEDTVLIVDYYIFLFNFHFTK